MHGKAIASKAEANLSLADIVDVLNFFGDPANHARGASGDRRPRAAAIGCHVEWIAFGNHVPTITTGWLAR